MRAVTVRREPNWPLVGWATAILGAIVDFAANLEGTWWPAMAIGLLLGLMPFRTRRSIGLAALSGALGWGIGLAWLATQQSVGEAANVLGGIVGVGSGGTFIVINVLLGAILGASGAWVGTATRSALQPKAAGTSPPSARQERNTQ
jgi:hypothetical protein